MKQLFLTFLLLLATWFTAWGVKAKTPVGRPQNLQEESTEKWYESSYTAPKVSDEWRLDKSIPANYVPVPGEDNLFMVIDDSGSIKGYRQRSQMADGTWIWSDVNPDIPDNYEKVDGLEDVYMVKNENGEVSYVKYIRNSDDTFCFVAVNDKGEPLDLEDNADKIPGNYVHESGNIYALYNDDGVLVGYRERVQNSDGTYAWEVSDPPENKLAMYQNGFGQTLQNAQDAANSVGGGGDGGGQQQASGGDNVVYVLPGDIIYSENEPTQASREDNGDGTYTQTDTEITTRIEDGYRVTYQTDVITVMDIKTGEIISTKVNPEREVKREKLTGSEADPQSRINSTDTLDEEFSRVSGKVSFNSGTEQDVVAKLNAERAKQGKPPLAVDTSGQLHQLASVKAADMAVYSYSGNDSPTYGSLGDMVSKWNVNVGNVNMDTLTCTSKGAGEIHTRLQTDEASRNIRMSEDYSGVAVAVAQKDGQDYVAEIFVE